MQDRTSARSAKPLATHGGPYIRVIRDLVEPAASPAKSAMPRKRKLRGDTHRLYFGHLAGCFNPSKHQAGEIAGQARDSPRRIRIRAVQQLQAADRLDLAGFDAHHRGGDAADIRGL